MTASILFKAVVLILIVLIFLSLTGGLVFLVRDKGQSERTVKSLTWRIALSIALFVLLLIGFATGLIQPHGLPPAP